MTRAKRARAQTGNVRKEPIRDTQKQYRHTHGLSCVEVMVRHAFQVEMITARCHCCFEWAVATNQ